VQVDTSEAEAKIAQLNSLITTLSSSSPQITINAITDTIYSSLETLSMILETMRTELVTVQIDATTDVAVGKINEFIALLDTLKEPRTVTVDVQAAGAKS